MRKLLLRGSILFLSLVASASVNATVVNGTSVLDVYGSEAWLYGYDSSTINVYAGADVSWLISVAPLNELTGSAFA